MNDHDNAPTPDDVGGAHVTPPPPTSESGADPRPAGAYAPPAWPPAPQYPPMSHPTDRLGQFPPYASPQPPPPPAGMPGGGPWATTADQPQHRPGYDPGPPAAGWPGAWHQAPYGGPGGGGMPPAGYGAWMSSPPPGDPWQPTNRAQRRQRRRKALAAGVTAGVLVVGGASVLIGHAAWRTATTPAAASSPSSGTGSSGTGSSGSGSSGFGSSGSGSSGSGSSGAGSGSSPFGSLGSSASGGSSTAAGAPANAAAIAKKVDAGLVDINTTLGYQGEEAAGTGMVLTSRGEILTNNHVIDGATSIKVTDIGNGRTYSATVVGYDRTQDVAVLQLTNASGLRTVTLGNSSSVTKGQAIVGVGNAGGAGGTPSYAGGSVVGLNQSITASDQGGGNSEKLVGLIETNADIQPGDSGGSLVNTRGQVIGMDTAASASTQFQAATSTTAYAIPINEAVDLANRIESGRASSVIHIGATGLLGVEVEAAGSSGSVFGGTSGGATTSGAVIAGVVSNSPAAEAGLSEGDTITAVDGHSVSSPSALTNDLVNDRPGTSVQLTYTDSSGAQHTVTVQLASGPPQ
jgi:S1-C subfamily serine protease